MRMPGSWMPMSMCTLRPIRRYGVAPCFRWCRSIRKPSPAGSKCFSFRRRLAAGSFFHQREVCTKGGWPGSKKPIAARSMPHGKRMVVVTCGAVSVKPGTSGTGPGSPVPTNTHRLPCTSRHGQVLRPNRPGTVGSSGAAAGMAVHTPSVLRNAQPW